MNSPIAINDKTSKTHHHPATPVAGRIVARPNPRQRTTWQAQPSGLSREETRRLVLEMIG